MTKIKAQLISRIHAEVDGLLIKNILITQRAGRPALWISLDDSTHMITRSMLEQILHIVQVVRRYLRQHCDIDPQDGDLARLSKVDFCMDLLGSFLPADREYSYAKLKQLVQTAMDKIMSSRELCLFHAFNVGRLKVVTDHGNLDTCYKFAAHGGG